MRSSKLSDRWKLMIMICLAFGLFLVTGPTPVMADDVTIGDLDNPVDFLDFSVTDPFDHEDQDPFKGWLMVYVQNSTGEAWGDFHFTITSVSGSDISNVDFVVYSPYEPTSSQTLDSWSVDNAVTGATLDLFFNSDPVNPGDVAWFKVYTDNTANMVNFGVCFYPTPVVPIPSAVWLFGSALIGLVGIRKRVLKA